MTPILYQFEAQDPLMRKGIFGWPFWVGRRPKREYMIEIGVNTQNLTRILA